MRRSLGVGMWMDVLLILFLSIAGYGHLCRRGEIPYSRYSDIIAAHLGTKTVLYRAWTERGEIPFWRADQFSGYTALTNPQSLYTYPLHFLFYLMPPEGAVGPTLWLHFVVAAIGLYLVGGVLGMGRWARIFMAAAALFNFKLILAAYAGWLPYISGIVAFPLFYAAIFYLVKRPGLRGALAVAAAGALCLQTGNLQSLYYSLLFLLAYLAGRVAGWMKAGQRQTARRVAMSLSGGLALSTGLAAYLYFPIAAEIPWISRGNTSYAFFLGDHALSPRHLLTFLYPEALGSPLMGNYEEVELWEDVAYFGIVPLILGIAGVVWGWRRHPTRFLAFSFLFSVLLTMDTPILRVCYAVLPGFRLFRCPARFLFLSAFFGVVLAGTGLDETMARVRKRCRRIIVAPLLAVLLLATVSFEGGYYARRYLTTVTHERAMPGTDYGRYLASDPSVFRVAALPQYAINFGWAAEMGLQLITGFDSYNFRNYQEYLDILQTGIFPKGEARVWAQLSNIARWDLLDALNVKYLISSRPMVFPAGHLQEVAHWTNQPLFMLYRGMVSVPVYLYRNNNFLPRAFWVDEVVGTADEKEMAAGMLREDVYHTAIVHDPSRSRVRCAASPEEEDRTEVLDAYGGYLVLQIRNKARRFLLISEVWHPGWRAFLDGERLRLCQADLALMGAWIPPGTHRLILQFRPLHWPLALGLSAMSGGILLVLLGAILLGGSSRMVETDPTMSR